MNYSLPLPASPAALLMVPQGGARIVAASLAPGGRVAGMTKGQFTMIDLLAARIERNGPAHVELSTWTAGIRDANNAAMLLDSGRLLSLRLLVDRSFATRQPAYCGAVRRLFGDDSIRCTRTHAKIALLRNDGWSVAVRSSMNLNTNPRFEQFDIDDDPAICGFFAGHFAEMSEAMPPGPAVDTREVDRVFAIVATGRNPFDAGADTVREAGVPIDDPAAFGAWVRSKLEANRAARRQPKYARQLASKAKVTFEEATAAVDGRLSSGHAAVPAIAAALL